MHWEEALYLIARGKAVVGLPGSVRGGTEGISHQLSGGADYGYTSASKASRFPIQLVSPVSACINQD